MEPVILDTDVLSFVAKADTRAALYLPMIAGKRLCVCFQTVAELRLWVLIRHWGSSRRDALDSLINKFVVLPYDALMAQHWANIMAHRRRIGRPIDCGDAWIAASALRHGAALITHNMRDYSDIPDLNVISRGR